MKNLDLTLKLIDTPESNEVVIGVSGNWHKITNVRIIGNRTVLDVEGSIMAIEPEKWDFHQKEHPKSSLIEPVKQEEESR